MGYLFFCLAIITLGIMLLFKPEVVMGLPFLKSYYDHFDARFLQKLQLLYRVWGGCTIVLGVWLLRLK